MTGMFRRARENKFTAGLDLTEKNTSGADGQSFGWLSDGTTRSSATSERKAGPNEKGGRAFGCAALVAFGWTGHQW
ncbi:hypothetical protein [Bradyrhizobium sp. B120]|uniref:hypothetical protein n=1 Tax=Bradyrhizobium sp. B120 TaxID=3410088 RepID=UPI003B98145D